MLPRAQTRPPSSGAGYGFPFAAASTVRLTPAGQRDLMPGAVADDTSIGSHGPDAASLDSDLMYLHAETWVNLPRDAVFPFFADAANLQRLTPPWLRFTIRTPQPIAMHPGARIEYRISLHGIPMSWLTEISAFEPPTMFVDRQLRGPYRTWIHTHEFHEDEGGTRLVDRVEFDMLADALVGPFIRRDLRRIFTYRHEALLLHFNQPKPWPSARIHFG